LAGERILIVDDDEDIREVLTLYLQREGYQVIAAEDGRQAVSAALAANPDLIILDMMSVMDDIAGLLILNITFSP